MGKEQVELLERKVENLDLPDWVTIRKVSTDEDYKAYCLIHLEAFGDSFIRRLNLWLLKKDIHTRSYVWLYNGEYLGIYSLNKEKILKRKPTSNYRVLYNFAITKQRQGKGYGKLLLNSAIGTAHSLGYTKLYLKVKSTNTRALNLYTASGFKITKGDKICQES